MENGCWLATWLNGVFGMWKQKDYDYSSVRLQCGFWGKHDKQTLAGTHTAMCSMSPFDSGTFYAFLIVSSVPRPAMKLKYATHTFEHTDEFA